MFIYVKHNQCHAIKTSSNIVLKIIFLLFFCHFYYIYLYFINILHFFIKIIIYVYITIAIQ